MDTYQHPGHVLNLTAPAGGAALNIGYFIGEIFVVASTIAAAGEDFRGQVTGVVDIAKVSTEVWAEGDRIGFDNTTKEATNAGPADGYVGVATIAAVNPSASSSVRLNAVGQPAPVETADLVDGSITLVKTAQFISVEQTGTGVPQNIAHGLGVVPSAVFVSATDLAPATTGDYTVIEGAHDATDVILTVTTGKKFKVIAWA